MADLDGEIPAVSLSLFAFHGPVMAVFFLFRCLSALWLVSQRSMRSDTASVTW